MTDWCVLKMKRVLVHGGQCSRYAGSKMIGTFLAQSTASSASQILAGLLLIFVVIVLVSGIIAVLLIVRARLRRGIPKKAKRHHARLDAWQEAGRRMPIPPSDGGSGGGDGGGEGDGGGDDPDLGTDDQSDDDDGEPTPPTPNAPETSISV